MDNVGLQKGTPGDEVYRAQKRVHARTEYVGPKKGTPGTLEQCTRTRVVCMHAFMCISALAQVGLVVQQNQNYFNTRGLAFTQNALQKRRGENTCFGRTPLVSRVLPPW